MIVNSPVKVPQLNADLTVSPSAIAFAAVLVLLRSSILPATGETMPDWLSALLILPRIKLPPVADIAAPPTPKRPKVERASEAKATDLVLSFIPSFLDLVVAWRAGENAALGV